MNKRMNRRGFTLLELLMVVIIIAILASLALPQYLRTIIKARRSEVLNVLGTLRSAEMRYKAEFGIYTANQNQLDLEYSDLNTGIGSWRYSLNSVTTNNLILSQGLTGTTISNCVMQVDMVSGAYSGNLNPDGTVNGTFPCP